MSTTSANIVGLQLVAAADDAGAVDEVIEALEGSRSPPNGRPVADVELQADGTRQQLARGRDLGVGRAGRRHGSALGRAKAAAMAAPMPGGAAGDQDLAAAEAADRAGYPCAAQRMNWST